MRFSSSICSFLAIFLVALSVVAAESSVKNEGTSVLERRRNPNYDSESSTTTASTSTESSSGATVSESTANKKNKKEGQYGNFNSVPVLTGGTLFYIGVGVSGLLWATGKFIEVKIDRQERLAERQAHSI